MFKELKSEIRSFIKHPLFKLRINITTTRGMFAISFQVRKVLISAIKTTSRPSAVTDTNSAITSQAGATLTKPQQLQQ